MPIVTDCPPNPGCVGYRHLVVGSLATVSLALGAAGLSAQAISERVAEAVRVSGVVFADLNGNGVQDEGEAGIRDVSVSDQIQIVRTDPEGRFALDARGYGLVFVSQPDGYAVRGPHWRSVAGGAATVAFPMFVRPASEDFVFVHASDPHVSEASVERFRRFRALVDSISPAFVLITGDLVRDALRVPEEEASGYYRLFTTELERFSVPVFTVPGNHEKFGLERASSLVSREHPLYGNRMYRSFLGPNYYSFTYGGLRFLGLDSVDYDDQWYHGHIDSLQVGWIEQELSDASPATRFVTFNHIPFVSAGTMRTGYTETGLAPSVIRVGDQEHFRHTVYNHEEVLTRFGTRLEIALAGHIHMREAIVYQTPIGEMRLHQAAAIVGPAPGDLPDYGPISGFTVYKVTAGRIDDGTFVPLDARLPGR